MRLPESAGMKVFNTIHPDIVMRTHQLSLVCFPFALLYLSAIIKRMIKFVALNDSVHLICYQRFLIIHI